MRLIILVVFSLLVSCKHETYDPCNSDQVSYQLDVKPIISTKCATTGCHNTNSQFGDFTTYSGVNQVCNNNLFEKRVFIKRDMPPSALSDCELIKLKKWYRQGHTFK